MCSYMLQASLFICAFWRITGHAPPGFQSKFAVYVINMEAEPDKLGTFYREAEQRLFPPMPTTSSTTTATSTSPKVKAKEQEKLRLRGGDEGDPHPLQPRSMPIKRWGGVIADEQKYAWAKRQGLYGKNTTGVLWGNIGASMAHLSLWRHAYDSEDTDYVLVFEDDEKINEGFWDRLSAVIDLVEGGSSMWQDFDMVNLNVLRPWGTAVTSNLLRVNHTMKWQGSLLNQVGGGSRKSYGLHEHTL